MSVYLPIEEALRILAFWLSIAPCVTVQSVLCSPLTMDSVHQTRRGRLVRSVK